MNYIRAKEGIFEVLPNQVLEDDIINTIYGQFNKQEIIAQADTIEELCDEFVGLVKDRNSDFIIMRVIAHSLKELKESLKPNHYDIIYGAVWTNRGLIYVAKMNEKGELELI